MGRPHNNNGRDAPSSFNQKIITMTPQLFPNTDQEDGMKTAIDKLIGDEFDREIMS